MTSLFKIPFTSTNKKPKKSKKNQKLNYFVNYVTKYDGKEDFNHFLITTTPESLMLDIETLFKEEWGYNKKVDGWLSDGDLDGETWIRVDRIRELTDEEHAVLRRFI